MVLVNWYDYCRHGGYMADQLDDANSLEEMGRDLAISNRVKYVGVSAMRCNECGELIPQGRRDAVPGCKLCVECAR